MFKLRDYQNDTISKIIESYEENKQRLLVVLATGMGKTVCATELHKKFKPKEKTIFLVDRIELAYQAQESFQRSNPTLRVGIEMGKHHASKKDDIVIACVHTVGRKGSYRIGKFEPDDFTTIIVDEAHMAVTDTYSRVLNYLGVGADNLLDNKLLVGLTATPNRTDGVGLGTAFDEIVVNYDLKYGIREGWLTDIDIVQIQTGIDLSDVHFTQNNITDLSKAINVEQRNSLILKAYKEVGNNEQAIIYASNVEHAYAISDLFNATGIPSFCIEANTDSQERKESIRKYKSGEIKVLTNYGTLTVGFDAPETSLIILARPIKSELILRQIIGRGIRPSKYSFINVVKDSEQRKKMISLSPKKSCKVIDIYDILGDHDIVSIPSLFGLNDKLEIPKSQERFFQEVVQRLDELEREKQVDISKITNLDEIDMIVKHQRLNIESLKTPEEISQHTGRPWLPVGDDKFEIVYSQDKKTLIVQKNQLDKFEVLEYDSSTKLTKKLQEFFDLSSAVKLGDEYADEFFDTTWVDGREEWETKGVSSKQANLLLKLYKGGIRVDKWNHYEDTNTPVLYYRKTGEKLDAGLASNLISQRLSRK
jgi:ATP-dependent helicase IRC3